MIGRHGTAPRGRSRTLVVGGLARLTSGIQHVDLAARRGRVEAVFHQPADRQQASHRRAAVS